MVNYSVYIDESGDLGINKGTRWFVVSAVVVRKSDEKVIRAKMNEIKTKLNVREIHFKTIQEFMKRAYIARELNQTEFTYMNVIVDTTKFDNNKIPNPLIAYNYACKYLLQRVTWYLNELGEVADLVLSARGTARDGELITYIQNKLLPYPNNSIYGNTINKVEAKTAATWDLLQLADVCATTTFLSYEENRLGFCVPCFMETLSSHLYNRNGKIESYGIKFFQTEMKPNIIDLKNKIICAKRERTPGATTT